MMKVIFSRCALEYKRSNTTYGFLLPVAKSDHRPFPSDTASDVPSEEKHESARAMA